MNPDSLDQRSCKRPGCTVTFTPSREWQEYCTSPCRSRHWYAVNKAEHNARRTETRKAKAK